ncbi:hypothetical protein [Microbacterium sp. zg-YB36]|uniref:hypothetical protein n=1 Tax=Microbacterium sp. zg-YB36 TaxID=2969407 RepID=UPI00214AF412|nr:hypothetical protein [Microbacterium sp. zg-YB36]MDL5351186.1 hypothetical protein [Microbacterium sp. zg-YB36]
MSALLVGIVFLAIGIFASINYPEDGARFYFAMGAALFFFGVGIIASEIRKN